MSVFRDLAITCPACGNEERHSIAESINTGNRAELRQQILDETFQRFPCARCGVTILVDGPMLLFDLQRHHWLELFPESWERAWRVLEDETDRRFYQTVVEHAAPLMQDHADAFVVRTVFGLPALREKLVAFDAAIDDTALEAVKLDMLRTEPDLLSDPYARLRLTSATDAALTFIVVRAGKIAARIEVARSHLDVTSGDAWQDTRSAVSEGPFVDASRLLIPGDDARPA